MIAEVKIGDLEQTLALLVEPCASQPWAAVKEHPALDQRAREGFLGRLAVDLPGESDENDIEYIDDFLREGGGRWGRAGSCSWGEGRWRSGCSPRGWAPR